MILQFLFVYYFSIKPLGKWNRFCLLFQIQKFVKSFYLVNFPVNRLNFKIGSVVSNNNDRLC